MMEAEVGFFSFVVFKISLCSKPVFLSVSLFRTRNGFPAKQLGGFLERLRCSGSAAVLPSGEEGAALAAESRRR
jgi:hypothetical protein